MNGYFQSTLYSPCWRDGEIIFKWRILFLFLTNAPSLLTPHPLSSASARSKTVPAAPLCSFVPAQRHVWHTQDQVTTFISWLFFFFFFSTLEPRRVLYPSQLYEDEGRGRVGRGSDSGPCHSNAGQTNKVQTARRCRPLVEAGVRWSEHSGGGSCVGSRGLGYLSSWWVLGQVRCWPSGVRARFHYPLPLLHCSPTNLQLDVTVFGLTTACCTVINYSFILIYVYNTILQPWCYGSGPEQLQTDLWSPLSRWKPSLCAVLWPRSVPLMSKHRH